jgi:hypothetical protein
MIINDEIRIPDGFMDYASEDTSTPIVATDWSAAVHWEHTPHVFNDPSRSTLSLKADCDEMVCLVEGILCFVAFLKYGSNLLVDPCDHVAQYLESLDSLMYLLCNGTSRGEGTHEWKLQKTVEMNHFLDDILNLGSAGGFSTQTGERGLKCWAKIFAVTAQKRSDEVFSGQVVSWIHESELLGAITGSGDWRETTAVLGSDEVEVYFSGDNFSVLIGWEETKAIRTLPNGYLHQIQLEFDRTILDWFHGKYSGTIPDGEGEAGFKVLEIQLHNKMRIKNLPYCQGTIIFRAHPNYRSGGPWYDYCLLNYDEAGENILYPAKIGCFIHALIAAGKREGTNSRGVRHLGGTMG